MTKTTKADTAAFFVTAEMCIMQPDCEGMTNPSIRIDPLTIDEKTEDEFVRKVEKMVRHAFEAARNQHSDNC